MTRVEALRWGRGDRRRLSVQDVPAAVLALVDERLGGRHCVDCRALGLEVPSDVPLHLDHLQPHSKGGDNHHLNFTWRCESHNCSRGAKKEAAEPKIPRWFRQRSREGLA